MIYKMKKNLAVLIAHYNNIKGLEESIKSIDEPFDIDIIIVDDGSISKPDKSHLIQFYNNGEIYIAFLDKNEGVGVASNRALEIAQEMGYYFLGRLDCGDICYKNKFKKQLEYLNNNPDIKLLGTWARVVDHQDEVLHMIKHPVRYADIKKKMYLNSMFLNPTVVFRADILDTVGNYPLKYKRASQDYAFFFKVIKHFKAENFPEVLMDYKVEEHSISTRNRKIQVKNRLHIVLDNFYIGIYPILGLFRGSILYLFPRKATTYIKKIKHRNTRSI